ncbi:MAG: hypothetical protein JNN12_12340 [Bacteroidetes Order II. Incertae sedis bacterium]|nr:hypothetical protein [Bacteroidetes Order II. bacterium]
MLKNILAVLAGLLSAIIIVTIGDAVAGYLAPPPFGSDLKNPDTLKTYIQGIPDPILALMLLFWLSSSLVAGYVSARIAPAAARTLSLICGGILLFGALLNMTMLPHPIWMMILAGIGYIPAAYAGGKLVTSTP